MKKIAILLAPLLLVACEDSKVTPEPSLTPVTQETPNPRDCDNLPEGYECP